LPYIFFGNDKKVRTANSKSKTSFPILGKSINKSGNRIATTGQALSLLCCKPNFSFSFFIAFYFILEYQQVTYCPWKLSGNTEPEVFFSWQISAGLNARQKFKRNPRYNTSPPVSSLGISNIQFIKTSFYQRSNLIVAFQCLIFIIESCSLQGNGHLNILRAASDRKQTL
jgi:hypothetical protein